MMKKLHPTQQGLIKILRANIDSPLTMIELMDELGVSSTSVVHHHIIQLERKNYLKRNPSNPRDYIILKDPERPITYVNQYGLAECGPEGSILDGNPVDRIPIATRLLKFSSDKAFIVVAKGLSMETKISPGDYVIAEKTYKANDGDIVVCINDEKAIIKQAFKEGEGYLLKSFNSEFKSFHAAWDFRIEGVVRNIIKSF